MFRSAWTVRLEVGRNTISYESTATTLHKTTIRNNKKITNIKTQQLSTRGSPKKVEASSQADIGDAVTGTKALGPNFVGAQQFPHYRNIRSTRLTAAPAPIL